MIEFIKKYELFFKVLAVIGCAFVLWGAAQCFIGNFSSGLLPLIIGTVLTLPAYATSKRKIFSSWYN